MPGLNPCRPQTAAKIVEGSVPRPGLEGIIPAGALIERRAVGDVCTMDDAKVLHASRLLHETLCDDLELRRLVVHVEPHHVSITIHTKRGRQESKVMVGDDPTTEKDSMTENVRLLDEWR